MCSQAGLELVLFLPPTPSANPTGVHHQKECLLVFYRKKGDIGGRTGWVDCGKGWDKMEEENAGSEYAIWKVFIN